MCVPIEPLLNKGKPLANVLNQSKIAVSRPTSTKKPVTVPFNESIEYEPTFTYGFESESRKRSLGAGYNCKAKKHCCGDIWFADLFGVRRYERQRKN